MPSIGIGKGLVQGETIKCNIPDDQGKGRTFSLQVENMLSSAEALQRPSLSGRLPRASASN